MAKNLHLLLLLPIQNHILWMVDVRSWTLCLKIAEVLKELVLPADGVTKIMEVFTSQMDLANSADETKRAQSDLLMENTHVRLLMDGAGLYPYFF